MRKSREQEAWFQAEVQQALDDPRPGAPDNLAMDEARALIDRIAARKVAGRS